MPLRSSCPLMEAFFPRLFGIAEQTNNGGIESISAESSDLYVQVPGHSDAKEIATAASASPNDVALSPRDDQTQTRENPTIEHHQFSQQSQSLPWRVPNELPPPFFPSEPHATPSSAASFSHLQLGIPQAQVSMQQPRPDRSGLVFGGYPESSSSSPAATNGFGPFPIATVHGTGITLPMGLNSTSADSAVQPVYSDVRSPVQPHFTRPTTFFNPEANFFPRSALTQRSMKFHHHIGLNGESLSRSGSQGSSQPPDVQERTQSHGGSDVADGRFMPESFLLGNGAVSGSQVQNGFVTSTPSAHSLELGMRSDIDAALIVRGYLLTQFGNLEHADYVLEITNGKGSSSTSALPLHGLLISRSPTLATMITASQQNAERDRNGLRVIRYDSSNDKFFLQTAFTEALQHLYGAPLLNIPLLSLGLPSIESSGEYGDVTGPAQQLMAHALGYASAGRFLQVKVIEIHGLQFAREVLRWENVESALAFCVQADGSEGSLHPFLHDILKFMIFNLPGYFSFVESAPQTVEFQRLPTGSESRPSISDPRVSRLTFGELSFNDAPVTDPVSSKFSSILLSLPFVVLKQLLQDPALVTRLSAPKVAELARSVIGEREKRRIKASGMKRVFLGTDESLNEETQWKESFHPGEGQHVNDFTLTRARMNGQQTSDGDVSNAH